MNGESQLEALAVPSVPLEPGMKNCHLCTAYAYIQIQIQNIYLRRISDEHLIQPIKHKLCLAPRSHLDSHLILAHMPVPNHMVIPEWDFPGISLPT